MQKPMIITAALFLSTLAACGPTRPPPELVDARAAYQRAAAARGVNLARTDLRDARQALGRAEASFSDVGPKQETRDLAYVATRKAEIANARASALLAMEQTRMAQAERERLQTQNATATRMQLERAKDDIARKDEIIASERRARAAADTAKEDERGLVLTLGSTVLFGANEAKLLPAAQERLKEIADVIAKDPRTVTIVGHTDSKGTPEKNEDLSRRRADAVRAFLVTHGAPEDRVKSEGVGSTQPVADDSTADGRAMNRRVEIILNKQQ